MKFNLIFKKLQGVELSVRRNNEISNKKKNKASDYYNDSHQNDLSQNVLRVI